jgi:hypothetical protein
LLIGACPSTLLSASVLRLRELDVICGLVGRNDRGETDRRNRSKSECKHSHVYLLIKHPLPAEQSRSDQTSFRLSRISLMNKRLS